MKVLHFGSYWMGENDIVTLMAKDLATVCEAKIIDTGLYTGKPSPWVVKDANPALRTVNWLRDDRVREAVASFGPDVVVCNAGAMSLTPGMHQELRAQGIVTVGIALSDPDVFATQGKLYAHLFDSYYTNAEASLIDYATIGVKAKLLPFAASASFHRPMPEVKRKYDIIIVGHARADRLPVVAELDKHFKVGLYGKGWRRWGIVPRGHQVNGEEQVRALNSGKSYLSFAQTVAGYTNVKVGLFEAVACGTPVFTQVFPEMERYFAYEREIIGFTSVPELVAKLKHHLAHPASLATIAENARSRLLREHTWTKRWEQVLRNVKQEAVGKQ
ncbi:MAG: Spore protein YkvP [Firmicutes bacterium]|nr:Spore protein YkvP [candidate division NPL-UPA2 bacterium]